MRLHDMLQRLQQFHPDSQVDIYNVIPTPEGAKYLKLEFDRVYLENDGAVITIELHGTRVR